MLLESLRHLLHPHPASVRAMGFLQEQLALEARHRRCADHWRPHLEASQQLIEASARQCIRRRKALVLGSGLLHDIPLEALSALFREVLLVDLAHLPRVRKEAARWPNVTLVVQDVSGMLEPLYASTRAMRSSGAPASPPDFSAAAPGPLSGSLPPVPPSGRLNLPIEISAVTPTAFLDDPAIDLVVSASLLSQLPLLPLEHLKKALPRSGSGTWSEEALEELELRILTDHLRYLRSFGGRTCLIVEGRETTWDGHGALLETKELLEGLSLPAPDREWTWRFAPAPEVDPERSYHYQVWGFSDLSGSSS